MLLTSGERISMALLCMAIIDLGVHAVSFTGSQAGHRHRHRPRQGQDPRGQGRPDPRGARRGRGRGRRRVPGRLDRQGHHHARSRRLRHHRGRAGRGARRRGVRDLHRRLGRVHRRPADRARSPQARARLVRRDARDGGHRRPCARAALGRVRAQLRRARPRALELHLGAGHLGRRGGPHHGAGDHLGRHARHLRGEGHDRPGARPPRRRRGRCSARSPTRRSTST